MMFSNFVSESCPATTLDLDRVHIGLVTFSRPSREQYPVKRWVQMIIGDNDLICIATVAKSFKRIF